MISGNRQQGRYNKSTDVKSNRKHLEQMQKPPKTPKISPDAELEALLTGERPKDPELTSHQKVEDSRPPPKPNFFQIQQGMTPSKSYTKSSNSDID
jgi:hypothetical protein